ncbi:hypothetical protein FKW77_000782 [Venturia effusa]|uniref:Uncharacterized protein n=1 Tax=Venturia effusa TaxID=50376 RepID=A0A517KVQ5_9PEZI|nr:hypothetical protein FKW77_000782 [Venturia effusa]
MALAFILIASVVLADEKELPPIRGDRLSVLPKDTLIAADGLHGDCEYSGIVPGVWYTGQCRTGTHYDPKIFPAGAVGMCVIPGLAGLDNSPINSFLCDVRWKGKANDANQQVCANFQDSHASTTETLANSTTSLRIPLLLWLIVSGQTTSSTDPQARSVTSTEEVRTVAF